MDVYHNILVDRYCALLFKSNPHRWLLKKILCLRLYENRIINHVFTVRWGTTREGRIAERQRVLYQGQIKVYPLLEEDGTTQMRRSMA